MSTPWLYLFWMHFANCALASSSPLSYCNLTRRLFSTLKTHIGEFKFCQFFQHYRGKREGGRHRMCEMLFKEIILHVLNTYVPTAKNSEPKQSEYCPKKSQILDGLAQLLLFCIFYFCKCSVFWVIYHSFISHMPGTEDSQYLHILFTSPLWLQRHQYLLSNICI